MLWKAHVKVAIGAPTRHRPGCQEASADSRTWSCSYIIISSYYLVCFSTVQYRVDFKMFLIRGLLWLSMLRLLFSQAEQNILMMKYNDNFLQVFVKCCEGALCWFTFQNLENVPWVLMLIPYFLNRHYWTPQPWSLSHMVYLHLLITFLSEFPLFNSVQPKCKVDCPNNFAKLHLLSLKTGRTSQTHATFLLGPLVIIISWRSGTNNGWCKLEEVKEGQNKSFGW